MKKLTVMLLIAAMVLGVSACGNSANKENTATESQMSTQEAEDLDAKINELTQKENSILENHKALWEKVFNSIDKSTVKDATATNYGDFLANSLDKIKDKFTDDELKSLKEDVEEIKKLEDELQPLLEKQSANASNKDSGKEGASVFPEFKAKDLDGNDVDSSIISKNAVTVLNFWFNGCSPCVQELPELNKLNEELKEKGGQGVYCGRVVSHPCAAGHQWRQSHRPPCAAAYEKHGECRPCRTPCRGAEYPAADCCTAALCRG